MSGQAGASRPVFGRKIAVLRPNAVGDFVFALPALHALKRAYPDAELVLLGLPWHAVFLAGRPGPVDRVIAVPPMAGIGLPPDAPDDGTARRFAAAMRDEAFDIACQMYGGGRYSNPLVASFGARLTVGARADGAPPLDRTVRHAEPGNRRLALLEIAALAGACDLRLEQELAVTQADREEAARVVPPFAAGTALRGYASSASAAREGLRAGQFGTAAGPAAREAVTREAAAGQAPARSTPPLVLLQPGSTDPRRCWPAASFAAVGDALARMGAQVAVNGTAAEAPLVRSVIEAMHAPAIDLSGKLGLGGLCGLVERAACVVSNDTGPLHLALAIGTPAVGIFWFTNLIDGTPLRPALLRAALSLRQDCPECGASNLTSRCAHDASFVADVPAEQVIAMAEDLLVAGTGAGS
ncbi:glycosyltransferase family 9 protein [Massilia sp. SYSU DXS3249]